MSSSAHTSYLQTAKDMFWCSPEEAVIILVCCNNDIPAALRCMSKYNVYRCNPGRVSTKPPKRLPNGENPSTDESLRMAIAWIAVLDKKDSAASTGINTAANMDSANERMVNKDRIMNNDVITKSNGANDGIINRNTVNKEASGGERNATKKTPKDLLRGVANKNARKVKKTNPANAQTKARSLNLATSENIATMNKSVTAATSANVKALTNQISAMKAVKADAESRFALIQKRPQRWTKEEIEIVWHNLRQFGKNFHKISLCLGTRTAAEVERFYKTRRHQFSLDIALEEYGRVAE